MENELSIYDRLGADNLKTLIDNFYDLVFEDERLKELFSKTPKEIIKHKQVSFLTQFLGGPQVYSLQYGHPRMRARHIPHAITPNGAIAWLKCMGKAIEKLDIDDNFKKEIYGCFPQAAFHMVNSEDKAE